MGSKSSKLPAPPAYEAINKQSQTIKPNNIYDTSFTGQLLEEQPLTPSKVLELKGNFDEKRRFAYAETYKTACSNFVKRINSNLKQNHKELYIEVVVVICNPKYNSTALLSMSDEYRCAKYDTNLINAVSNYIITAYKDFGITKIKRLPTKVTFNIKIPESTTPFG